jgi:hypothetical protein
MLCPEEGVNWTGIDALSRRRELDGIDAIE